MTEATMYTKRRPEPLGGVDTPGRVAANAACNFILQQGLEAPEAASCPALASALLFQARAVALAGLVAVLLQSAPGFAALAAVLWWSALLPRWNPFDALHNRLAARRPHVPRLTPAPTPRRFAQGEAGSLAAVIAVCLLLGAARTGLVLEAFFLLAVAAAVFGRLCSGTFLFHVLRGRVEFALRTLPWGDGV